MKFILATNNQHKLTEIRNILLPLDIEILSLNDLNINIEIEENALTLEENAHIKSSTIFKLTGINTIADDTGLMVDLLDGKPGVFSARYAGEGCSYEDNNRKLLSELKEFPKPWKATFVSCIDLYTKNIKKNFVGIMNGEITETARGKNGFGYDPIFIPEGYTKTYAELTLDEKNKISHRAKAVLKLYQFISSNIKDLL